MELIAAASLLAVLLHLLFSSFKKLGPYKLVFLSWILIDQFPLGSLILPPPPFTLPHPPPPEVTAALTRQCIGYSPVALTPYASILLFFPFLFLLGGKASHPKSDYPPL